MTDLMSYRRFFAEEIQMIGNLRTAALVDALATVPRERFLPPGPWVVRGEADFLAPLRHTPGDDPRFVYHNVAVGIDPERMLFNGAPGLVASAIDALGLEAGQRVLHVGAGAGYYTAVIAHTVGSRGHVTGIEVDEELARRAAANLAEAPWAEARPGDGRGPLGGPYDAILVNAGVTHPEPTWLEALAPGGRMVLPLTATMPVPRMAPAAGGAMANISKGLMILVSRTADPMSCGARLLTFVSIYSAVGLRDEAVNADLGRALSKMPFPPLRRFRLDTHDADESCWCHTARGCWSTGASPQESAR